MKIIEMKSITKHFGSVKANMNIDFDLNLGETHALVGENGAGKTTLMRILYGQYEADFGTIFIEGREEKYHIADALNFGIGMVHQNFMQIENMSIIENVILSHVPRKNLFIDYKRARCEIEKLLLRFGMRVSPDTHIENLCVGERQKIEIIKSLYLGAKVLILDEPTAVLTPQESDELFNIIDELKAENKSIIFISHKLREVINVADRISVMRKGEISARFQRGQVDEMDVAQAMIGKQKVQLLQNQQRSKLDEPVCEVKNLWYFDKLSIPKLRNLSFTVNKGEILGIGGVEGNGQSELINSIIGMFKLSGGEILLDGKDISNLGIKERRQSGVGYISEDRMSTGLALKANINENVICGIEGDPEFSKNGFLENRKIEQFSERLISEFDIRGINTEKPVGQLSGGNMQKIIIAREISRKPKLLIAAQPTRGLDIGAINFVREQLLKQKEQGTAIILVSADLEELLSLSDRMIIMYEGALSGEISSAELLDKSVSEKEIGLMMGGVTSSEVVKV